MKRKNVNKNTFVDVLGTMKVRYLLPILILMLFGFSYSAEAQNDYDLALSIYPEDSAPVLPGDVATFIIDVHNQGEVAAKNIKVVDYLPVGLQFVTSGNTGWSSIGDKVITTITSVIQPGDVYSLSLKLQLKNTATPFNISNYAEIALTQDENGNDTTDDDIDSTTDSDPNNDNGAFPYTETDDFLDGNGILDEDDHDVALLIICNQNACNDHVNISLNAACSIEILADMIVENPSYPDGAYTVILEDENGNVLPSNMVNGSHVGMTLKVTAFIEGCEPSGCWGYATIEDKFAIDLFCQTDTVDCGLDHPDDVGLPLAPGTIYVDLNNNTYIVFGNNGCSDITLTFEDHIEMLPCQNGSPYVIKITREWLAIDEAGNEATCTSYVWVRKGNISDVVGPPDFVANPLLCGQYPQLEDGNPDPIYTGFPDGISCPNMIAVYQDLEVPSSICVGVFDVLREWTVVDWCNSNDTVFTQIIKIMDNESPTATVPAHFYGSSYIGQCQGAIDVVNPTIFDNCSDVTFTIAYKEWTNINNNFNDLISTDITGVPFDYHIHNLPVGKYRIAYFITDLCGNESQFLGTFEIRDDQDPTPICIIETTVTLDQFGHASVFAMDMDNGSFDNCGIDKIRVRRMQYACDPINLQFKTSTNFCCEDGGKEVMVVFRVYDKEGNFNDCMIAVTVIDDQVPVIQCPGDFTFTCSEYDSYGKNIPIYLTGQATAYDNCTPLIEHFDVKAFNECGVGIIVRNWTATDDAGNEALCKQYIEIESDFDFDVSYIEWPEDTDVNQCIDDFIDPDATGRPILPSETCSSFDVTYNDIVVQQTGAGCGIVQRTFTIVDNCALDPNNNSFSYVQEIGIFENEDPIFLACADITFSGNNETCNGYVDYIATAEDNCTAEYNLVYSYTVDLHNDGLIEEINSGNELQGVYPVGVHRVVFRSEDQCGNPGTCAFLFTVKEDKNPTPICIPISLSLGNDGQVEVWASDFNLKSFDNCTEEIDLIYSFSEDILDANRTYDCDFLTNGLLEVIPIEMYVWDQSGNYDKCSVTLTLTDTNDQCPDSQSLTADIGGKVMTMEEVDFADVEIDISGELMGQEVKVTNISGDYTFEALSLYDNYTVRPYKNDDVLNGITTLDIVNIQKHILGIKVLTDKSQLIAADVNNNQSISGVDIIQLRKLLLGVYDNEEFPNNTSWRFMPVDFVWNPVFPYSFPEEVVIDNLVDNHDDIMFYGVKIGDINGSAKVDFTQEDLEVRNTPKVLYLESAELIKNENINVPFYINDDQNIEGFQLALKGNNTDWEIVGISSPMINILPENYHIVDNVVYISWFDLGGIDVNKGDVLFNLDVKSHIDGIIEADDIKLDREFLTEIFNQNSESSEIEIEIRNDNQYKTKAVQLLRNEPNPFTNSTSIPFNVNEKEKITFQIFDINGQLVNQWETQYEQGDYEVEIDEKMLTGEGVYYLLMESENWNGVVKMVKLR